MQKITSFFPLCPPRPPPINTDFHRIIFFKPGCHFPNLLCDMQQFGALHTNRKFSIFYAKLQIPCKSCSEFGKSHPAITQVCCIFNAAKAKQSILTIQLPLRPKPGLFSSLQKIWAHQHRFKAYFGCTLTRLFFIGDFHGYFKRYLCTYFHVGKRGKIAKTLSWGFWLKPPQRVFDLDPKQSGGPSIYSTTTVLLKHINLKEK